MAVSFYSSTLVANDGTYVYAYDPTNQRIDKISIADNTITKFADATSSFMANVACMVYNTGDGLYALWNDAPGTSGTSAVMYKYSSSGTRSTLQSGLTNMYLSFCITNATGTSYIYIAYDGGIDAYDMTMTLAATWNKVTNMTLVTASDNKIYFNCIDQTTSQNIIFSLDAPEIISNTSISFRVVSMGTAPFIPDTLTSIAVFNSTVFFTNNVSPALYQIVNPYAGNASVAIACGNSSAVGNSNGTGTDARFGSTLKYVTGTAAYLYVSDTTNRLIRTIDTSLGVSVMVSGPTVPDAPTIVSLVAGNGQATFTYTPPANNGGMTVTGYQAYASSDTTYSHVLASGSSSSTLVVPALTNGTTYTLVMVALNAIGRSAMSDSYSVTPTASGGGGGDPYVTTFSNISYKLPTMDAPIRYFQTMESGKLLTVNAQLKTVERSEMADDTLRSLIVLRKKMTTKQYAAIIEKLSKPELLCFFERISIQYGDQRLVVNLWDSKFELVENTLRCPVEKVDRPDLLKKAGGIYSGYKAETVKLVLGGTSVYLSVYDSPMIRNGISVESPSLKGANGVIVNALSAGAMTLRSLASVEPVSTRDSLRAVTKVETFVDHDGVRTRNIVTYK